MIDERFGCVSRARLTRSPLVDSWNYEGNGEMIVKKRLTIFLMILLVVMSSMGLSPLHVQAAYVFSGGGDGTAGDLHLRSVRVDLDIVFTTSHSDFAMEADDLKLNRLTVRGLGCFDASSKQAGAVKWISKKSMELFAYLFVNRGRNVTKLVSCLRINRLCGLLWSVND